MSNIEPKKPYIYQPYGTVNNKNMLREEGIYAIGGVRGVDIKGLTKEEANEILPIFLRTN